MLGGLLAAKGCPKQRPSQKPPNYQPGCELVNIEVRQQTTDSFFPADNFPHVARAALRYRSICQSSPNFARYLRSLSASFAFFFDLRDSAKNRRAASESVWTARHPRMTQESCTTSNKPRSPARSPNTAASSAASSSYPALPPESACQRILAERLPPHKERGKCDARSA